MALELFYANGGAYIVYFERVIKVPLLVDNRWRALTSEPPVRLRQANQFADPYSVSVRVRYILMQRLMAAEQSAQHRKFCLTRLFWCCWSTGQIEDKKGRLRSLIVKLSIRA